MGKVTNTFAIAIYTDIVTRVSNKISISIDPPISPSLPNDFIVSGRMGISSSQQSGNGQQDFASYLLLRETVCWGEGNGDTAGIKQRSKSDFFPKIPRIENKKIETCFQMIDRLDYL